MKSYNLLLILKIVLFIFMIFIPFLSSSETIGLYNYLFIFALQCMYFYPTTPVVIAILLLALTDIVLSSMRKKYHYLTYLWIFLFDGMIVYDQFFVSKYIYHSLLTSLHIVVFLLQVCLIYLIQRHTTLTSDKL